jgi:hypothetical protein
VHGGLVKNLGAATDVLDVFTLHRVPADQIDAVLSVLPNTYSTIGLGEARLVVGPTGVFVVSPTGDNVQQTADDLVQRAVGLRTELAQRMSLVPFIDALVIVGDGGERPFAATGVPLDLLAATITQGPDLLADAVRERLLDAVTALLGPKPAA